jgi:glutathione synthase
MTLQVAVQMDPIGAIRIAGDTTFALMLEAQARGHSLFYYTPNQLFMENGEVFAEGCSVEVRDRQGDHASLGANTVKPLTEFDVVLLRQDPPFDMSYITSTHLLERVHPRTLVVNDPAHVRNAPEKILVTSFQDLTPPTLITRSPEQARMFQAKYGDVVVKPLYGNGGASVFRLLRDDGNLNALVETFQAMFREPFIVQQYLPAVSRGDKRIILIDGEPVGAINRIPAQGETRSNMHVGGRPEPVDLSARDLEICARIGPELKRRGLVLTGIDVIGGYLTEINVTSPTGVREVKRFGGADIASLFWTAVENRAHVH